MGTKYRVVRTYYNEECMKEYYHNMGENLTLEEAKELQEFCTAENMVRGAEFHIWEED